MKKEIKFHLLSTAGNLVLIFFLLKIHQYIINEYIDDMFSIRSDDDFLYIYLLSFFVISWVAPFSIYKFRNYKKHYFVFIGTFFIIILLLSAYDILSHILTYKEYYNGISDYISQRVIYISIKEETLIASLLISALIYINQLIIGKKLLPTKYKKQ